MTSSVLSFALERGAPPLDEWRGQPEVLSPDMVVVDVECPACGRRSSSMSLVPEASYRSIEELVEAAKLRALADLGRLDDCGCGGRLRGTACYHSFVSAIDRDIVVRASSNGVSFLKSLVGRRPEADLYTWTLDESYAPADAVRLAAASASIEQDAIRRSFDCAFGMGRDPGAVESGMVEFVDRLGLIALEPYVEDLLRYTAHPLDRDLADPAGGTESERAVRDKLESLARREAQARPSRSHMLFLATVVRKRVSLGQRPLSALDEPRRLLEEAARADDGSDEARTWTLLGELALVLKESNDWQGAVSTYRRMMVAIPDDAASPFNLGLLAAESGDVALADEVLQALAERETSWFGDPSYLLLKARLELVMKRSERASQNLREAVAMEPDLLASFEVRALPDYLALVRLVYTPEGDSV